MIKGLHGIALICFEGLVKRNKMFPTLFMTSASWTISHIKLMIGERGVQVMISLGRMPRGQSVLQGGNFGLDIGLIIDFLILILSVLSPETFQNAFLP